MQRQWAGRERPPLPIPLESTETLIKRWVPSDPGPIVNTREAAAWRRRGVTIAVIVALVVGLVLHWQVKFAHPEAYRQALLALGVMCTCVVVILTAWAGRRSVQGTDLKKAAGRLE